MTSNILISRFTSEMSLLEPQQGDRVSACLAAVAAHPKFEELMSADRSTDFWQEDGGWCRPYVVVDGVLQIPVKGVLLNNFPYQLYDWATGYEYIVEAFKRGCGDFATGAIKGIAFVSHSPGGLVAGCFDAVDTMVALKEQTGVPVAAFAHEMAYSAAYAVCGGVADRIYVSRTGGVGSIGVVTGHLDVSGAMEKAGLKFTYIASDPSKVEGNPYEPLSEDAKQRIQERIDEIYGIFVAAVSRGRGIDEATIRDDLKAYCYTASQATSNGLADEVGSLDDATAAFAAFLDEPSDNTGEDEMAEANQSAVDQAAMDAARAEGRAEGETAEQARISAILGSDEAEGRDSLAKHFAFSTRMSADDAVAALKASPKVAAAAPASPSPQTTGSAFENAMSNGNPEVGAAPQGSNVDADQAAAGDPAAVRELASSLGLKGFGK